MQASHSMRASFLQQWILPTASAPCGPDAHSMIPNPLALLSAGCLPLRPVSARGLPRCKGRAGAMCAPVADAARSPVLVPPAMSFFCRFISSVCVDLSLPPEPSSLIFHNCLCHLCVFVQPVLLRVVASPGPPSPPFAAFVPVQLAGRAV